MGLALLLSVSYFFFLYWSHSTCLYTAFDAIASNIDEVLSINPSTNVFILRDFNIHHKHWLTCLGRTDRPGKLYYISNDLIQMVNFLTPGLGRKSVWLHSHAPTHTILKTHVVCCMPKTYGVLSNWFLFHSFSTLAAFLIQFLHCKKLPTWIKNSWTRVSNDKKTCRQ